MGTLTIDSFIKKFKDLFSPYITIGEDCRILPLPDEDFQQVKKCRQIGEMNKIKHLRSIGFVLDERNYMAIIGQEVNISDNRLIEVDLNRKFIYPAIEFGGVRVRNGIGQEYVDEYVSPILEGSDIEDDALYGILEPFTVFEYTPTHLSREDRYEILCEGAFDNIEHELEFSESLRESYSNAIQRFGVDDSLIRSFFADNWQYAYLEIYRLLEPIFAKYHIKYFKKSLNLDTMDCEIIEKALFGNGLVYPDETKTIEQLFEDFLKMDIVEAAKALLFDKNMPEDQMTKKSIGLRLYAIRNRIVHHPRSASINRDNSITYEKITSFTDKEWNMICDALMRTIIHFDSVLNSISV